MTVPVTTELPSGARLFPISANTKRPQITGWQKAATADPAQIAAWAAEFPRCAWAIAYGESGLILVEPDPKALKYRKDKDGETTGDARADAEIVKLFISWGINPDIKPHFRSRSGGRHYVFAAPPGVDLTETLTPTLPGESPDYRYRQGELARAEGFAQECVECKINGFGLIPPSSFGGSAYTRWSDGPIEAILAPQGLLDTTQRITDGREAFAGSAPVGIIKPNSLEAKPLIAKIVRVFTRHPPGHAIWRDTLFGLVDQFGKKVAWQIGHQMHDGSAEHTFQTNDIIKRARETARPGDVTLKSFFKYAREVGDTEWITQTTAAMFGLPLVVPNIDEILAEIEHAASLPVVPSPPLAPMAPILGRAARQADLWGPLLANVPHIERTPAHPEMPDTGHPLRDAINAAIPGIMAVGDVLAIAVVEATHPQTAAKIGVVTNTVKARAEALRQDAEHSDTPPDFTRSVKGGVIESDNPDNLLFFTRSLGIDVRYNAWNDRVELRGWKWPVWTEISDGVVARLRQRAGQTGTRYVVSKEFVWDMLLAFSFNNVVDPALQRLNQLEVAWGRAIKAALLAEPRLRRAIR